MAKPLKVIYDSPDELKKFLGLNLDFVQINDWKHEANTNYLVVGQSSYQVISSQIPLGLRGAQYYMICEMKRVGLNDGSNYIFTYAEDYWINRRLEEINDPDFETPFEGCDNPPEEEHITDINRAVGVFYKLTKLPVGTWFGYDYESKSFPNEPDFIATGLSISTETESYWFDFRYLTDFARPNLIDYEGIEDEGLRKLNEAHRAFLEKHSRHCIVFNVNFEYMATYRYLRDFYEYRDLNVVNIMSSRGVWQNLKWTARYLLNINSWDDQFEEFNSALSPQHKWDEDRIAEWDDEGNLTEIYWDKLSSKFSWLRPEDIEEMKEHAKVCLNSFYIIPSYWLGKYCCKDAFYTLKAWIQQLPRWNYTETDRRTIGERIEKMPLFPIEDRFKVMSEAALDIYCDGKLAESLVNNGGQILNIPEWKYGCDLNGKFILMSVTALSRIYCKEMMKLNEDRNNLDDYSPLAKKLIKLGIDVTIGGFYLSKELMFSRYYDEGYEGCLNINQLYEDFSEEDANSIIGIIQSYGGDLNDMRRRRKVHEEIGGVIDSVIQITPELAAKHENTITYNQFKNLYEQYSSYPWVGISVDNYQHSYEFEGQEMECFDIAKTLMEQYLNVNTLQGELAYTALHKDMNSLLFNRVRMLWIDEEMHSHYNGDYDHDYQMFMDHVDEYVTGENLQKIISMLNDQKPEEDGSLTYQMDHMNIQHNLEWLYPETYKEYVEKVRMGDIDENYKLYWLVLYTYVRIFAKYIKANTYFVGLYYEENTNYNKLDKYWMGDYQPCEWTIDKNMLAHPHFKANEQFSYRWSSNFHTVPSKNEMKRCTGCPDDALFYYFDISSMEVRQIAYLARDPKLLELFEARKDVYRFCASVLLGDEWEQLEEEDKAEYRTAFKVILLAYFYLRGARTLAPELDKSVQETQRLMDFLGQIFATALEFRKYVSNYPLEHEGRLLTVFGEDIISDEEPYRQLKHGINTIIQSSSAVMLVYGFYNLVKEAWREGIKCRPVGFVHDSSQLYFQTDQLWNANPFFKSNVTDFLFDRFKVNMAFDLMVGSNYFDICKLSNIDETTIELKGTGLAINGILDRLDKANVKYEIINPDKLQFTDETKTRVVTDIQEPLAEFIHSGAYQAIYHPDNSSYKIQLRKL